MQFRHRVCIMHAIYETTLQFFEPHRFPAGGMVVLTSMSFPRTFIELPPGRSCHKPTAFSLVEVTIALGIAATAIVSVLGMMPVGLSTMREAVDQTTEAQILRQISTGASLYPFDRLGDYAAGGPYLFTQDGTLQTSRDAQTRYSLRVTITNAAYPGSSNAMNISSNLAAILVETERSVGNAIVSRSTNVIHVSNSGNSAL